MKRILSLALAAVMAISAVPMAYAADTNDHSQGTQVVFEAANNESYTITVPAKLNPGQSGTVTLVGSWPDNKTVSVTADKTVTLTNSIKETDTKTLDVNFDGISEAGDNTQAQTFTKAVSVDPIEAALFGTWSGKFNYNVEIAGSTTGCDTLYGDSIIAWGNEQGMVTETEYRTEGFVKVSDEIFTAEQMENFVLQYFDYDVESIVTADIAAYQTDENMIMLGDTRNGTGLGYCFKGSMDIEGPNGEALSFTPGFYLAYGDCVVSFERLTIPGYTGFPHSEHCGH